MDNSLITYASKLDVKHTFLFCVDYLHHRQSKYKISPLSKHCWGTMANKLLFNINE